MCQLVHVDWPGQAWVDVSWLGFAKFIEASATVRSGLETVVALIVATFSLVI